MSDQRDLITGIEEIEDNANLVEAVRQSIVPSEERQFISDVKMPPLVPQQDLSPTDRLIMMALEGNVDVDKLEKLIDLKNREEERAAKREFDRNFSLMQSHLPVITKAKPVKDNDGKLLYYYAPLDDIQRKCDPIIAKYKFSYRWKETALEQGKRITMVISGHGHSEESTFDVPVGQTNKVANQVQAAGSMTTFGHRYTYVAGFGITVEGADDDGGFSFDDGVKYAQYFTALDNESDQKELYRLVTEYVKNLRDANDFEGAEVIKKYYTRRKKELAQ